MDHTPQTATTTRATAVVKTIHHGLGNVENNLKQEDCLQNVVFHCQDDKKKLLSKKCDLALSFPLVFHMPPLQDCAQRFLNSRLIHFQEREKSRVPPHIM